MKSKNKVPKYSSFEDYLKNMFPKSSKKNIDNESVIERKECFTIKSNQILNRLFSS